MADQNPTLSTKAPSTADICAKLMSTARAPDIERYEHQHALMEANRNEAADQWHAGMPMTERERRFFEYGFASGWTRCRAVAIVSQPSAMLSAPAAADGTCIHGKGFQCVTCWPHPAAPSDAVAPSKKDRGPTHG